MLRGFGEPPPEPQAYLESRGSFCSTAAAACGMISYKSCGELFELMQCPACTFGPPQNCDLKKKKFYDAKSNIHKICDLLRKSKL